MAAPHLADTNAAARPGAAMRSVTGSLAAVAILSCGALRPRLLNAFAIVALFLPGAAGEALGYDRHLKSGASETRTHSLFRQGSRL